MKFINYDLRLNDAEGQLACVLIVQRPASGEEWSLVETAISEFKQRVQAGPAPPE